MYSLEMNYKMQSRMNIVLSVLNKERKVICIYMHKISLERYTIITVSPCGENWVADQQD